MIRGMYSAAAGMLVQMARQQIIAANLANVNTVGFKRDVFTTRQGGEAGVPRDFESLLFTFAPLGAAPGTVGSVGTGVLSDPVVPIFAPGELRQTERALDVALSGDGFFLLQNDDGTPVLTRAGTFDRDAAGRLVGSGGRLVLGEDNTPIVVGLDPQSEIVVSPDGAVVVDGQEVGRLALVDVDDKRRLRKLGENLFTALPGVQVQPAGGAGVVQNHLEMSNVNPTESMIEMTALLRAYEANQRLLQLQDQMLERAVNDVGRI